MQLNIYLISHPIIQQLSSQVMNPTLITQNINIHNHNCKQLGSLMIYEVMRQWMQVQKIYVQQINQIKEFCILKQEESYIIITDLVDSYNIIIDALNLIPKVELKHINLREELPNNNYQLQINTKNRQKIIIINRKLNSIRIMRLLDYLTIEKHVKINQIKIICITCNSQVLEKIGTRYSNLNIYTTKITKS